MGTIPSSLKRSKNPAQKPNWLTKIKQKCLPISSKRRNKIRQVFTCTRSKPSSDEIRETNRQYDQRREIALKGSLDNVSNNRPIPIVTPSPSPQSDGEISPPISTPVIRHSTKIGRHGKRRNPKLPRPNPVATTTFATTDTEEEKGTTLARSLPIPENDIATKGKRYRNRVQRYSMKSAVKSGTPYVHDVLSALSISGAEDHMGELHVSIAEPGSIENSLGDVDDELSNDEEKSSTEREEEISIVYATPTIASAHVIRPLPSPSSLSEPRLSVGSGLASQETSQTVFTNTRQSIPSMSLFPSFRSPSHPNEFSPMASMHSASHAQLAAMPPNNHPMTILNAVSKGMHSESAPVSQNRPISSINHSTSMNSATSQVDGMDYRYPSVPAVHSVYSMSDDEDDENEIDPQDVHLQSRGAPIMESINGSKIMDGKGKVAATADKNESIPQR